MLKVEIIGNLVNDPETSVRGGYNVTNFRVATNDKKTKEATYLRVTAWGAAGDTIAKYAKKGSKIWLSGQIGASAYMRDGAPVASLELSVRDFEFLSSASMVGVAHPAPVATYTEKGSAFSEPTSYNYDATPNYDEESGLEEVEDDGLPF